MRIIVAEDHSEICRMLSDFLKRQGHTVTSAADGEEAVGFAEKSPFDVLITDIFMPKKDGIQTIAEFRTRFPNTKIIAMSGGGTISGEEGLRLAKRTGADMTLVKPFSMSELAAALESLRTPPPPLGREISDDPAESGGAPL